MDKNEYLNIYNHETTFWWYKVLHQLVEQVVNKVVHENEKGKPRGKIQELKILDAGCGTGRMLEILQKYGSAEGIDSSEEAIHLAKERGLAHVTINDLNSWETPAKFNLIVSLDVLYHSGIIDDMAVLKKFYEAFESNGTLILNLAAFEILRRSHDVVVHTKRRYRKKELLTGLKKTGFKIEKAGYRLPHLFILILLSKLFRFRKKKSMVKSDLNEIKGWLNQLLLFFGKLENYWFMNVGTMPFGSSLFIIARK